MINKRVVFFIIATLLILVRFYIYNVFVVGKTYNLYYNKPGADGIFTADSGLYVDCSSTLISHGKFARIRKDGSFEYQMFRTPGYSVFLAFLRGCFGFSLADVILVQLWLTVLTAFMVYKMAELMIPKLKYICALFMLYDVSTTSHFMFIMTETLFTFFIAVFMYHFLLYVKTQKLTYLVFSAIFLAFSAYIRPISYYLAIPIAITYGVTYYKNDPKRTVQNMLTFLAIVYGIILLWHLRNYIHMGVFRFCSIGDITVGADGLIGSYGRSYIFTFGLPPWQYYIWQFFYLIFRIMCQTTVFYSTDSYFFQQYGLMYSHFWLFTWLIGFLIGMLNTKGNIYMRFLFVLLFYFTLTTVFGAMKGAGERFRIPMIPYIAIFTSIGWYKIYSIINRQEETGQEDE